MREVNHVALNVSISRQPTILRNVFGSAVERPTLTLHISRPLTDGNIDLAPEVYDIDDLQDAKLVGDGPAIHHFGIEVDDRHSFIIRRSCQFAYPPSNAQFGEVKFRSSPTHDRRDRRPLGRYEKMRE